MSEYPYRLDKAVLKIALQDRKISQNVSVKLTRFSCHFFGKCCRNDRFLSRAKPLQQRYRHHCVQTLHGVGSRPAAPFFSTPLRVKNFHNFFAIIFLFFRRFAIKQKLFFDFLFPIPNNFLEYSINDLLLAIYAVIKLDALTQPRGVQHHDSNGYDVRRRHPARRRRIPEGQAEGSSRHPGGRLRHPSVANVARAISEAVDRPAGRRLAAAVHHSPP
jgi:hypothetical protein